MTRSYANEFIGRERELSELRQMVDRYRIVTLVGTAGVGKTRLAHHFAAMHGERTKARIYFCDLRTVGDPGELSDVVSRQLGARGGDPNSDPVGPWLGEQGEIVLILDNFDRLLGCANIVERWSAAAPSARIVVTSRQRLSLDAEHVLRVDPLALVAEPKQKRAPALELLLKRTSAAGVTLDLPREEAACQSLVKRLDGIPLAIELAAARLAILSPTQLLSRLDAQWSVLGDGEGRSLRQAIALSWSMLSKQERACLSLCTVFRGGFDVTAAEAIVAPTEDDKVNTLQALQTLCDRSLLVSRQGAADRRLDILESIREFAIDEAHPQDLEDAGRRHAELFLSRGTAWWKDVEQLEPSATASIMNEQENLLAAFHYWREAPGDGAVNACRLLVCFTHLIIFRWPTQMSWNLLTAGMNALSTHESHEALRGNLLILREAACVLAGRLAEANADLALAERLADKTGDEALVAQVLIAKGHLYRFDGRLRDAQRCLLDALVIHRRTANKWYVLNDLSLLAEVERRLGEADAARHHLEEALRLTMQCNAKEAEAAIRQNLGELALDHGDVEDARRCLLQARKLAEELDLHWFLLIIESLLIVCDLDLGLIQGATAELDAKRKALSELGQQVDALVVASYMSYSLRCEGRRKEAEQALAVSALGEERIDFREAMASCQRAAIRAGDGDIAGAEALFASLARAAQTLEVVGVKTVIDLEWGHLDLAYARAALQRGDLASAAQSVTAARARSQGRGVGIAEARLARRCLLLECERFEQEHAQALTTWVVEKTGAWFCRPDGVRIDCHRRRVLRLLLAALAERRVASPGEAIATTTLFELGWPGERIAFEAADSRLRVAISALRKLGLGSHLQVHANGYLLDPAMPLRVD